MEQLRSPLPPAEVPAAPRARPRRWRLLRRPLLWAGALGLCFAAGLLLAPRLFPRTSTAWRSPQVVTALPSMSREANAFNEEARELMKARLYVAARAKLESCLEVEPAAADCHKNLGTVWAQLGDSAKGAREYRRYLELAPNGPSAEKIREILDAYMSAQ